MPSYAVRLVGPAEGAPKVAKALTGVPTEFDSIVAPYGVEVRRVIADSQQDAEDRVSKAMRYVDEPERSRFSIAEG